MKIVHFTAIFVKCNFLAVQQEVKSGFESYFFNSVIGILNSWTILREYIGSKIPPRQNDVAFQLPTALLTQWAADIKFCMVGFLLKRRSLTRSWSNHVSWFTSRSTLILHVQKSAKWNMFFFFQIYPTTQLERYVCTVCCKFAFIPLIEFFCPKSKVFCTHFLKTFNISFAFSDIVFKPT